MENNQLFVSPTHLLPFTIHHMIQDNISDQGIDLHTQPSVGNEKHTPTFAEDPEMPYSLPTSPDDTSTTNNANLSCSEKLRKRMLKFFKFLGPTWLISCALLDPGAIEASLQAGAYAGYSLLWVTLWTTVMVFCFQAFAARIGVVTGKSLAHLYTVEYEEKSLTYLTWILIEISVIGDDLQAVIGCTLAIQLMTGLPFYAGVLIASSTTLLFTIIYYYHPKGLSSMVGVLMFTMLILYLVTLIAAAPPAGQVFYGVIVPSVPKSRLNK